MYYICNMRNVIKTKEFEEFYDALPTKVKEKVDYVLLVLCSQHIINAKFVKRLIDTEYYELRVSVDNEYRIIVFSIDAENIIESSQILLLNGFVKKSTKDYKKHISIANKIIENYETDN